MKISHDVAIGGHDYYIENRVGFVGIDGTCGHAIVEGSENYEIEFDYIDGEILNFKATVSAVVHVSMNLPQCSSLKNHLNL